MTINASLTGRLRNTKLPKSNALLPLFEAVVNAIQAVDEAHAADMHSTRTEIRILRGQQEAFNFGNERQLEPITGFVVSDNGEGFHDQNMKSFELLDSEYRADIGCRGVGRLLWLKAFDKVEVASRYLDIDMKEREFVFTARDGVSDQTTQESLATETGSDVRLLGFREPYRQYAPRSALPIANRILEHCLWFFIRPGGAPNISVVDDGQRVDLSTLYEDYMVTSSQRDTMTVKGQAFDLIHLKLKATSRPNPELIWCAARRVVTEENLVGKLPGLHGRLKDGDTEYIYVCYLTSPYLDLNVRSERTSFDIPEVTDAALDEDEPSLSDIRQAALAAAGRYLESSLSAVRKSGRERVEDFVDNKAPRYRPILRHIDEEQLTVDPAIGDRELELQLHRHLADLEADLLVEGQSLYAPEAANTEDYDERLRDYLGRIEDVKKSDLAAYVSRRRVILDILEKSIQANEVGDYSREDVIHTLIMPMRLTSDDVDYAASNLWVIDEGLAFHNYLASDKPIASMPITGSTSRREPDLAALKVHPHPAFDGPILVSEGEGVPLASIVVVEIKRPMRNDAAPGEKDPLTQALRYLELIREGKVRTAKGRPIIGADQIPGFCYVIADLTESVRRSCKLADLRQTPDGQGYFGYNGGYNAYIEVNSFDRLLNLAHQRNRAFFDRLGLPVG